MKWHVSLSYLHMPVQTLAADLGIPEEVALALEPTIPTVAPPLKTPINRACTSGKAED